MKVVSEESPSRFKICDEVREISLEVEGSKYSNSKFLREGKFVKIVDPKIDKENETVTINDQSLLIIGQPFTQTTPTGQDQPIESFSATYHLDKLADISGKFKAKLVFLHEGRKVDNVWVVRGEFKDEFNYWQSISLWQSCMDLSKLDVGSVYSFDNLKMDKWPNSKPHYLRTKWNSKVLHETFNIENFEGLQHIDVYEGQVIGLSQFKYYFSCATCTCSLKGAQIGSNCPKCRAKITDTVKDFVFVLTLDIGEGISNRIDLTGFRKILNVTPKSAPGDDLEQEINNMLEDKKVSVEYTKRDTNVMKKLTMLACKSVPIAE